MCNREPENAYTSAGRIEAGAIPMIEIWRGDRVESVHHGHAVIARLDARGHVELTQAWGDPDMLIYPRSSCKMIQALPLVESAGGKGLGTERLALACASHNGAAVHVEKVAAWLADLGLSESDLRCGVQIPDDVSEHERLIRAGEAASQLHNNCSGKHAGFLMLNQQLGGDSDYVLPDHPVQKTVRQTFEEVTGIPSPGYGIDGCSAPNFVTTLAGLAGAMAQFAAAQDGGGAREKAMLRLRRAMAQHPDLVAGQTRACTELMSAMGGEVAIKTGAEAVFVAMLPAQRLGIALKIVDGGTRASEAAITALLIRAGVLDPDHPAALTRLGGPIRNRRGLDVGHVARALEFS